MTIIKTTINFSAKDFDEITETIILAPEADKI
jgi:hypothetical protein